jgi:hypothetical protein
MFLEGSVQLKVYADAEQTQFPQELLPSYLNKWSAEPSGVQTIVVSVPASGSQSINLNGLSNVTGVMIFSDAYDINVNINSLGNILYKAGVPGFMPLVVTSLSVTNTSSTYATNVTVAIISG